MKLWPILLLLAAVAGALPAEAASGTGRLDVSVQAAGTITFTIESVPGSAITGLGTANVTTAFGTVSKLGPAPTGSLIRILYAGGWRLSGLYGYKVTKVNLNSSSSFTLAAQLTTAPLAGVQWSVNLNLNSTSPVTCGGGAYGSVNVDPLDINFADTVNGHVFNNIINFIATSN